MDGGSVLEVVTVAGRRTDPVDAKQVRFPASAEPVVAARVERWLADHRPRWLVSAAAAGSDLVALETAIRRGTSVRVVLPFAPERFRETSVTDRGEDWGTRYDHVIATAQASGDLVVLNLPPEAPDVYALGNEGILDEALRLGSGGEVAALILWEGQSRGSDDNTAHFAEGARRRGFSVHSLSTLSDAP